MRYILLDVDGVLTSTAHTLRCRREHRPQHPSGMDWLDPSCVEALRHIVNATGASVVISSSWRELGLERLQEIFKESGVPVVPEDTTPVWILVKRDAIAAWIAAHQQDKYVILDDADQRLGHQVKTDPETGLTMGDAEKAIRILHKTN